MTVLLPRKVAVLVDLFEKTQQVKGQAERPLQAQVVLRGCLLVQSQPYSTPRWPLTLLARTSPRYQRNRFAWWILQSVLPARMSGFSNQCNSFHSKHGLFLGSPQKAR